MDKKQNNNNNKLNIAIKKIKYEYISIYDNKNSI